MDGRYLELFEQLVRLRTTHEVENRPDHERCRELLKAEASRRGLKTKVIPSDPYPSLLVGEDVDRLDHPLLLTAHVDVVQGRDEQFQPRLEGGKMIGRGVSDMKFAVPVFFEVLDQLAGGKERVLVAFTFDEEIGGDRGIRYLLDEVGLRPQVCFLPDGGDNFQIEADEKGVLQFRVKTKGKAAHGSRPWLGENAIDKMLAIYADLRQEIPAVDSPDRWTNTLTLSRMVAGDAANKVPDNCEACFDLRFVEGKSSQEIKALVTKVVGERGRMEPIVVGDNFHLDMDLWCSQAFQQASTQHLSQPMGIYRSEGASDARFFTKYNIPVIIAKPRCAGHHSDFEWIELESLAPYTKILLDFTRMVIERS